MGTGDYSVGTWGQSVTRDSINYLWCNSGYMGQEAVRGSNCLQWVHEGRGSNTCTWGRGCSYLQWVGGLGVQLTVGT